MPVPHSRHVALTEPLTRFVDGEVARGRHVSASEAARAGLRLLTERQDAASLDGQTHG